MSEAVKITRAGHRLSPQGRARLAENGRHAAAASIAASQERTAARLDDLEFLASWGATRAEAADRAGFPSVPALVRFCHRHQRPDLLRALPTEYQLATAGRWAA